MLIDERKSLLETYESEIETAYAELLASFLLYLENGAGEPATMAGRCGAQVAAAHKRCKRGLVFAALATALAEGLDITPTVAEHLCARLIGRGVDFRAALEAFATPGRTAATKSSVRQADLADFEAALAPQIQGLISAMKVIRERHREEYREKVKAATGKP
ncbi:hypothetical protein [Pseudomonas sp. S2.OTC.A_B10]|uniref:hypothetical protein n=1 Tax=Pseudomonas sp. S2.OTC.A_B10 TaxID=3237018 RepID=UPI003CF794DA